MKTAEDLFCEAFYPWLRNQTTPHKMSGAKAAKIIADCRRVLEQRLVPAQMAQSTFEEYLSVAHKVILHSVSWDEAKAMGTNPSKKDQEIPKT